ncbi:hypothetical protein CDAR_229781 [Caerostris darwini]|uniref:Uncharacterized protein n=1 Tax=Caerostris darwini TaxID=1538125 RepID=A0AAV4PZ17_9ARAC|nr:hypothetical protein CDAR_229781 [Caerostris darwini]
MTTCSKRNGEEQIFLSYSFHFIKFSNLFSRNGSSSERQINPAFISSPFETVLGIYSSVPSLHFLSTPQFPQDISRNALPTKFITRGDLRGFRDGSHTTLCADGV